MNALIFHISHKLSQAGLILLLCVATLNQMQAQTPETIYLLPGQGADHRLFQDLNWEKQYRLVPIIYSTPERGVDMNEYAQKLAEQIDTTESFTLIGASLGGMLAVEMNQFLNPKKTIIISSAKCRKELPLRYRFQKFIPLFELIPRKLIKAGALFLQPIVESDCRNKRAVFKAMLRAKGPKFLKRTIRMIINWDHVKTDKPIIHIHGSNDRTIPLKNLKVDYIIENGSHMISLTKPDDVSVLINHILSQD